MSERVDVIVIGMGPGGEEVAERLAESGLSVIGIEKQLVGGECPYWGCVPSKMIVRGADALAEARRVPLLAGASFVSPDWSPVAKRIREQATDNWNDRIAVERFERLGGRFVRGAGRLDGPGRVVVNDSVFEAARAVVVATGSSPTIPPIPGLAGVPYWTNRELIEAGALPETLVVLGGGAIGLELAQAVARFGVKVTVIEASEGLLAAEEPEAGQELVRVLSAEGLDVRVGVKAIKVARTRTGAIEVILEDGDAVAGERVLVATGRRNNLVGLGLETIGLDPKRRAIAVDAHLRAGEKLWAVGDCTGAGAFTDVAVYQARIAIADILGSEHVPADYHALPRVTFTDPEVGAAGLTERQAIQRRLNVRIGFTALSSSTRGWIHGPGNEGFIKLVEDADRGVLVGATVMGPSGGEVMSMLALAIHASVPVATLRTMIYAYPTFHRGIEGALTALTEDEQRVAA
ncbi:MAG: NAD(P)/FAD-dependent oxidoreductase [Candidatus Dormibacteraeota bacterium]|nr:NAD(P)/FAD-dependent oxidoreductase [Candidatus Dormibacteraeota bacterium]